MPGSGDPRRDYPPLGYTWYVMGVLLLVMAFAYLDRLAISFLLAPIQNDLGLSDTQAGLLLGPAFTLAFVIAAYPAGHLADRYSRKWLLFGGLLFWSGSTCLSGFARDFTTLAIGRAGIGLGEACIIPTVFSLVADYFPPGRRGRATAVVTIGTALGAGAALFGGGHALKLAEASHAMDALTLVPNAAWGKVMVGFGTLGVLMALLLLTVREPRRQDFVRPDMADEPSASAFWQLLKPHWRSYALVLAPYVLLNYAQYALAGWIPTLLSRREGLTPSDAAISYGLIVMVASPAAAILGGILADRMAQSRAEGRFTLVRWFLPPFMLGTALICLGNSVGLIQLGIAMEIFATGIVLTTVYTAMADIVPGTARGRMLGTYSLLATVVGVGLGPTLTALATDLVFADKSRLDAALMLAITPAWLIAMGSAWVGRRHFARLFARARASDVAAKA